MSLEADVDAIVRVSDRQARRAVLQLAGVRRLNDAYRRVFFEADGETLRPDAAIVLDDLGKAAGLEKTGHLADEPVLRARAAQRQLLMHLYARFRFPAARYRTLIDQIERLSHSTEE